MARPRPSRVSATKVLRELRTAAKKGDRAALTLALAEMRTLALSPRYWERYLTLLGNPLARLVDLLVIKQGERIAHQKGWKRPGGGFHPPSGGRRAPGGALLPASSSKGASTAPSETSPMKGLRGRSPRSKRRPPQRRRTTETASQPSLFEL
ncbi:MAG: hypothetical protein ACREM3_03275 [Candidatus Rokuibacteriota bacterium]